MQELNRLYELKDELLSIYKLVPNFDALESLKKEYVENASEEKLFYEVISRKIPSWDTEEFFIPLSKLNNVGSIFGKEKETLLRPYKDFSKLKKYLLDVYFKSDLGNRSKLKIVYEDGSKQILHYFLFLSEDFKDDYRLKHYDNIIELNKKLFMFELIIKGEYKHVDIEEFNDVKSYFSIEKLNKIPMNIINSMDEDIVNMIKEKEEVTFKLVNKLK